MSHKVDIEAIKLDLAQFNKDSLLDPAYKLFSTYSQIEMNNFINKRIEFCSKYIFHFVH